MDRSQIEALFFRELEYNRDNRKPPDKHRRGRFLAGWEDFSVRGQEYAISTLKKLTWHNLGYRFGRLLGPVSKEEIYSIYAVLEKMYYQKVFYWEDEILGWFIGLQGMNDSLLESILSFFRLLFHYTRCPNRAWFGLHKNTVSLVVGGIYLGAIIKKGHDKGVWLLLDKDPPPIFGMTYKSVKSTQNSKAPLVWAHSSSLMPLPKLVEEESIWELYGAATEKIFYSKTISADRDSDQRKRGKRRLSDFWISTTLNPEKIQGEEVFLEGARRTITINTYERNPLARHKCIKEYGFRCAVCDKTLEEIYGKIAKGSIHVHHLTPLWEINPQSPYTLDPVKDLRPVCPNCHMVLHLRRPPYSIQELKDHLNRD